MESRRLLAVRTETRLKGLVRAKVGCGGGGAAGGEAPSGLGGLGADKAAGHHHQVQHAPAVSVQGVLQHQQGVRGSVLPLPCPPVLSRVHQPCPTVLSRAPVLLAPQI